jgi:hypothetical protein
VSCHCIAQYSLVLCGCVCIVVIHESVISVCRCHYSMRLYASRCLLSKNDMNNQKTTSSCIMLSRSTLGQNLVNDSPSPAVAVDSASVMPGSEFVTATAVSNS